MSIGRSRTLSSVLSTKDKQRYSRNRKCHSDKSMLNGGNYALKRVANLVKNIKFEES